MKTITVKLGKRSYKILIGIGIIKHLGSYLRKLKSGNSAYVITTMAVKSRYARALSKSLTQAGFKLKFKIIPDTEKSKSIETAAAVIKDLARFDRQRKTFIIAFGGGVVGDLAGFVASIYKRGIPCIQIPTTLLAQVDSSIGGKTAVDLSEGKNLVGAFYQPSLVVSDVTLLKSLGLRQVRSGLAEVIKYGVIRDRLLFSYLEKNHGKILALSAQSLEFIVRQSSRIKAKIVQQDEREEKGLRTILNFGHTIGHAIEAAAGYRTYSHGEAVALGMLVAAEISKSLRLLKSSALEKIEKLIKAVGLPLKIKKIPLNKIIQAHYYDKKFKGAKNRFVLLRGIGKTKIVENIALLVIEEAIKQRL